MNPRQISFRVSIVIALLLLFAFLHVQADDTSPAIGTDNITQMEAIASFKGAIVSSDALVTTKGFIAGQAGNVVTLLNTRTGETQTLPPIKDIRQLLAVSPDGKYLVYVALGSNNVILSEVNSNKSMIVINGPQDAYDLNIGNVVFSSDSKHFLLENTREKLFHQWVVQTGKEMFYDSALGRVLRQAAYNPDGTQLLSLSDSAWMVLDTITGKTLLKIPVTSKDSKAQYLPDGKTLAVYQASQIELWDIQSTHLLSSMSPATSSLWTGFQIAVDGKWIAAYEDKNQAISIWQLDDLRNPKLTYRAMSFVLPKYSTSLFKTNGKLVATYGQNNKDIQMMNITTGETSTLTISDARGVTDVAFSNDGKLIFVAEGYAPTRMSIWSLEGGEFTQQAGLPGTNLTLSADGTTLYTTTTYYEAGSFNKKILSVMYAIPTDVRPQHPYLMMASVVPKVVNVRAEPNSDAAILRTAGGKVFIQGRDASSKYVYLPDYQGWVRADAAYLKLDDNLTIDQLVVLNPVEVVALAATATPISPKPTRTPRPTNVPTATPGIAQLPIIEISAVPSVPAAPQGYEPITLANVDQVRLLGTYDIAASDSYPRRVVQVSADSNRIFGQNASSDNNYFYNILDLRGLSQVTSLKYKLDYKAPNIAGISNDGRLIAYYLSDFLSKQNYIVLWDAEKQVPVFQTPNASYSSGSGRAVFNSDSSLMAETVPGSNINVWDLKTQTIRYELPSGRTIFSADDQSLVLMDGNLIRVYDAETGIERHNTRITILENLFGIHLSHDANSLIWASSTQFEYIDLKNDTATIYDLGFGNRFSYAPRFAFNADNSLVLMIDDDSDTLHLFDTHTGRQLATWKLKKDSNAAFSPDGRLVVTSNPLQFINLEDGTITPLPGHYVGTNVMFSNDATSLIVGDRYSSMVLGIPNAQRPGWQPVMGHVNSSGISVRAIPNGNAETIGYAKGDVRVGGREMGGNRDTAFLPELGGWVSVGQNYLTLDTPFYLLPIISSDPQP